MRPWRCVDALAHSGTGSVISGSRISTGSSASGGRFASLQASHDSATECRSGNRGGNARGRHAGLRTRREPAPESVRVGRDGRDFLSIRRQGTEPEDEYPGAPGLHEQDVRRAQGPRLEVREEGFRKHELLASDAAARRCERSVCDDLRHGGQGNAGHDLGVIETERPHGEAQDPGGRAPPRDCPRALVTSTTPLEGDP